ncbi:hypothetical protein FACS1894124_5890 [Spirochaetia bacterium]|nr:hypothetical protein FACS1894124_5890 [Spirochaetia bacterium]
MMDTPPESERDTSAAFALKETEERLVAEIMAYLDAEYPDESVLARRRFSALQALGQAAAQFPLIRDVEMIRGELRDRSTLLDDLCSFAPSSRLLHLPTRIVAARGYFVAKSHAFTLLSLLIQDLKAFYTPVRQVIFSIMCTLMAEEVYFSCLEDHSFPGEIKLRLTDELISLWDSGTDPRSVQHLPALQALWTARDSIPPTFGTMDGSSELIQISFEMEKDWQDFLIAGLENEETKGALEEFLFGLSCEEIQEVRKQLVHFGALAVSRDEVRSFLGSRPAYTMVKDAEPRAIYDFFIDRREMAAFRKRTLAPGPWKTLEEIYLRFRLTKN